MTVDQRHSPAGLSFYTEKHNPFLCELAVKSVKEFFPLKKERTLILRSADKDTMAENKHFARIYRILFALIGWFGVIGHFIDGIITRPAHWTIFQQIWNFFSFFTIQTNLLVVLWLTAAILLRNHDEDSRILSPKVRGALTLYITITFLVYALLLDRLWNPTGLPLVFTTISHYITRLAFILDWLLFEKKQTYQWRYLLNWLIYPLGYFVYTQIYGGITGNYLYPFLDRPVIGWGGLILRVVGLSLVFLALGSAYIAINRRFVLPTRKQHS